MARQWGFTGPYVFGTLSVVIMQLFLLNLTYCFTNHCLGIQYDIHLYITQN